MYQYLKRGQMFSTDYKIYIRDETGPISPWHDIPLCVDEQKRIYNMVVEMPRWTNAKMECNKTSKLNPIVHDIKDGKIRYLSNIFPLHGILWNYGFLPQTWSDPNTMDEVTGIGGDKDPLDVMEIGRKLAHTGEVVPVKVLGAIALIDQDETDWKIVAVNTSDPIVHLLNDINDIEKNFTGLMDATTKFLRCYKVPDGKKKNTFGTDMPVNREMAVSVINNEHDNWRDIALRQAKRKDVACACVTLKESPTRISYEEAAQIVADSPEFSYGEMDPEAQDWYYFPHNRKKTFFRSDDSDEFTD